MRGKDFAHLIQEIDGYLCELAGAQIRDGLHTSATVPEGEQLVGPAASIWCASPNLDVPSLPAAVAAAFGLDLAALLADPGARLQPTTAGRSPRTRSPTAGGIVTAGDALARRRRRSAPSCSAPAATRHGSASDRRERCVRTLPALSTDDAARRRARRCASSATSLMPSLRRQHRRDRQSAARAGRSLRPGRAERRADARHGARPADRAQLLRRRSARHAQPAAWQVGQAARRASCCARHLDDEGAYPESGRALASGAPARCAPTATTSPRCSRCSACGRAGSRRTAGCSGSRSCRWRARPAAHRRRLPHLRLLPRRLPAPDRGDRRGGADGRRAGRAGRAELRPQALPRGRAHGTKRSGAAGGGGASGRSTASSARKPGTLRRRHPAPDRRAQLADDADFAEAYVNWGGYAYTADDYGVDARDDFETALAGVQRRGARTRTTASTTSSTPTTTSSSTAA